MVDRRSIPKVLGEIGLHRRPHFRQQRGGRVIVEIDSAHWFGCKNQILRSLYERRFDKGNQLSDHARCLLPAIAHIPRTNRNFEECTYFRNFSFHLWRIESKPPCQRPLNEK